jgi:hypothetical protein
MDDSFDIDDHQQHDESHDERSETSSSEPSDTSQAMHAFMAKQERMHFRREEKARQARRLASLREDCEAKEKEYAVAVDQTDPISHRDNPSPSRRQQITPSRLPLHSHFSAAGFSDGSGNMTDAPRNSSGSRLESPAVPVFSRQATPGHNHHSHHRNGPSVLPRSTFAAPANTPILRGLQGGC